MVTPPNLPHAPPNSIGGHLNAIFLAIKIDIHPSIATMTQLTGDGKCEADRHVKKEDKLKRPSSFCSKCGLDSGDCRRIISSEEFVVVKAISIPADTKSSRYELRRVMDDGGMNDVYVSRYKCGTQTQTNTHDV